jgi:hypothetical protein
MQSRAVICFWPLPEQSFMIQRSFESQAIFVSIPRLLTCFILGPLFNGRRVPRVGAGQNTSTVIPASLKRRWKGNPVVSDETVMYGYESSATLTTNRLHYKLQTCPLVREGAPRRRVKQFSGKRNKKVKSGHGPKRGARHQDILTDRPSVVK